MGKSPKNPDLIVPEVVEDLRKIFGDDLVSVALYGSAVRGDYRPGHSDVNFFVVLEPQGFDKLERAFAFVKKWGKRGVAVPRFVTEDYIRRSLDSFPVEFLGLKLWHRTVYGRDVLADLEIDSGDLRLQCERELKGKLLHLREGFLATLGKRRALEHLIRVSLPSFSSVFEGLVVLRGQEPRRDRAALLRQTAELFDLDVDVFDRLAKVRAGQVKLGSDELVKLCRQYIREIEKVTEIVDRL
ncbi:MAG: hypothetical protein GXO73_03275 [Calditrichaeota bacterium]|nr:hypothetical protein [Calditrichota bacterium]